MPLESCMLRNIVGASLTSLLAVSLIVLPTPSASAATSKPLTSPATTVKKEVKKTNHHNKHAARHAKKAAKANKHVAKASHAPAKTAK